MSLHADWWCRAHGVPAPAWEDSDWKLEEELLPGTAASAKVLPIETFACATHHLDWLNEKMAAHLEDMAPRDMSDFTMALCLRASSPAADADTDKPYHE